MTDNMKFKDKYSNLLYTKKDLHKLGFADLAALKSYVEDLIKKEAHTTTMELTPREASIADAAIHSLDIIKEIIENVQEEKLSSIFKVPLLSSH
jgi:chemotaxis protein histidine kinase CheA